MKHLKYFYYLIKHKWFVLIAAYQAGIPLLGFMHDMSKFLPSEWIPYANHFYGKKGDDIRKGRDETGYYKPTETGDKAFDFAWLLHQKRNKHHWQYWVLPQDEGGLKVLEMPVKYRREMICDWIGAGRAQGTPNTAAWYAKNKNKMMLASNTREWVDEVMRSCDSNGLPNMKVLARVYPIHEANCLCSACCFGITNRE